MLVCAFLCASCTRDRGCSAHPAFPAPSVLRDSAQANLGQIAPREGEGMFGNGNASATHSLSSPAQAGDPVRRGFSAQALLSLEYWIAGRAGRRRMERVASDANPTPVLAPALSASSSGSRRRPRQGRRRSTPQAAAASRSVRRLPSSAWRGGGGKR